MGALEKSLKIFRQRLSIMLEIKTWGKKDNPPLLMLHGFLGCSDDWKSIAKSLSLHFYCIAPDLPGHGKSPLPGSIGEFEQYADSCIPPFLLSANQPVHILGYSMGGRIAFSLLARNSLRFGHALIESASPGIASDSEKATRIQSDLQWSKRFKNDHLPLVLKDWYLQPVFTSLQKSGLAGKLLETRSNNKPESLSRVLGLVSPGRQPNYLPQILRLDSPLALISGELDVKYCRLGRYLQKRNKNYTFRQAPACGHIVHLENPEYFISCCRQFFLQ